MPQLLEPCSLKHLRVRNRAVVAPMTRVCVESKIDERASWLKSTDTSGSTL